MDYPVSWFHGVDFASQPMKKFKRTTTDRVKRFFCTLRFHNYKRYSFVNPVNNDKLTADGITKHQCSYCGKTKYTIRQS